MLNSSSYLTTIQRNHAEQLAALPTDDLDALTEIIQRTGLIPTDETEHQLHIVKALFSFRWAHARLAASIDDRRLGELQTNFAAASIEKALITAWRSPAIKKMLPKQFQQGDAIIPGLFVLGLGKLGGRDLNFSSDIDLIAFYNANTLPIASVHGRTDVCNRVLKKMSQILNKNINGHCIWRVDWRLSPNASTLSMCMSTEVAEDYYFFHSFPWQRLAMIKSRVIAGDTTAGNNFLAMLEPYLWRQNLDYQMIDEIHRLKNKINLEHPQLKQNRNAGTLDSLSEGKGFNLKLGRGGIREIEFIANAMQLLWGGKKTELRHTTTVEVLKRLSIANLIEQDASNKLIQAYRFLRKLEDTVQIQDNLQTHNIPKETKKFGDFLNLLGMTDDTTFWIDLEKHRRFVAGYFNHFFESNAPFNSADTLQYQAGIDENKPRWVDSLPNKQKKLIDAWSQGFSCYAVSPSQRDALSPLFQSICSLLNDGNIDRPDAIDKLHHFFSAIPKGGQYLRLLVQHPTLLENIVIPLIHSPHMQHLLSQSPHIVDVLLEPSENIETEHTLQLDSAFVLHNQDFEVRLERLRRFVNEQLYAQYLALLRGTTTALKVQQNLTRLAEHSLELGVTITCDSLGLSAPPIAIIGMGKLGMRAMAPMSDLDLIFVARDDIDLEQANNFSHRLQHLMEIRTREGRVYEMDMRLRPSGRSGPVTVSLSSFKHYHLERAKTWEHIALCAGRPVTGDPELLKSIDAIRSDIISRQRDTQQFKLDAAKMLWRIQQQRIGKSKSTLIDIKLMSGGLMELDYLSACVCLHSIREPSQVAQPYDAMVRSAFDTNLKRTDGFHDMIDGTTAHEITQFLRKLQIWTRILGIHNFKTMKPQLLRYLLNDFELTSATDLATRIDVASSKISKAVNTFQTQCELEKPNNWEEWVEQSVIWH